MNTVFHHALRTLAVPQGGRVLLLYGGPEGMAGDAYHPLLDRFRQLQQQDYTVFSRAEDIGGEYDAVFVQCPKQREETEALLALALERSKGLVMAAAASDAGGGRLHAMLEAYGVPVHGVSKNHCRAVWTTQAPKADRAVITRNLSHLALRQVKIGGLPWWSVPGLFGWDKVDAGSRLLMQRLPDDLRGHVADFGCGYGYISAMLAQRFTAVEAIDAFDLDARAVACCQRNAPHKVTARWQDIRDLPAARRYDAVVMNPPFHNGKKEALALGMCFIEQARVSLAPGGRFFLVANRHLPYEKTVPGITVLHEGEGYKIMMGRAA